MQQNFELWSRILTVCDLFVKKKTDTKMMKILELKLN